MSRVRITKATNDFVRQPRLTGVALTSYEVVRNPGPRPWQIGVDLGASVAGEAGPVRRVITVGTVGRDGRDALAIRASILEQPARVEERVIGALGLDVPVIDDVEVRIDDPRHVGAREVAHLVDLP